MQLATTHLYRDFILLDPCDAVAVNEFLGGSYASASKGKTSSHRGSSGRKSFHSPLGRSGGSARRSSLGKSQSTKGPDAQNCDQGSHPLPPVFGDDDHGFDMDNDDHGGTMDLCDTDADDEDDPWKPLNPYEQGKLKVKPFKKGWDMAIVVLMSEAYIILSHVLLLYFLSSEKFEEVRREPYQGPCHFHVSSC